MYIVISPERYRSSRTLYYSWLHIVISRIEVSPITIPIETGLKCNSMIHQFAFRMNALITDSIYSVEWNALEWLMAHQDDNWWNVETCPYRNWAINFNILWFYVLERENENPNLYSLYTSPITDSLLLSPFRSRFEFRQLFHSFCASRKKYAQCYFFLHFLRCGLSLWML